MKVLLAILLALPAFALAQQCSVAGDAIGFSLDMQTLATEKDCLKHCQNNTNCQWYSFDTKLGTCNSLYNRQSIDSSCPTCRHGETSCRFPSECFVKGGCSGAYIGRNTTLGTAEACLEACYKQSNCKWFTYLNVTRVCNFYSACILDDSQPNSVSGERDCYEDTTPLPHTSKVFIQHSTTTGIFTLPRNTSGNATTCTKPPSFPSATRGAVGNVVEGSITVCGGTTGSPNCWRLNATSNTWQTFPAMPFGTMYGAQALTPKGWWVTGGSSSSVYTTRTAYYNGTRWVNGTNLPNPGRMDHCLARIDESQTFMSGGVKSASQVMYDAHVYNHNTEDWLVMPSMTLAQREHACVSYRNGSDTIILTAGGSASTTTVQAFNLSTRQWRRLANLPTAVIAGSFVSYAPDGSDMFLVNPYYGNVLKFNPTSQTFSLVSGLTTPVRGDFSVVAQVDDSHLFGCQ